MDISGGFLKLGYPQIPHFNGIFHEINHPCSQHLPAISLRQSFASLVSWLTGLLNGLLVESSWRLAEQPVFGPQKYPLVMTNTANY